MGYTSKIQGNNGHIAARVIIDATASPNDKVLLWLIHNGELAILYDRLSIVDKAKAHVLQLMRSVNTQLARIEQNLRPVIWTSRPR